MITNIKLTNCGPIEKIEWKNLSNINLIIGENASGKTLLLKSLYVATKSLEEYKKGNDNRSYKELLNEKLRWTFQLQKLGNLVTKGHKQNKFKLEINIDNNNAMFSFGASAEKGVGELLETVTNRKNNSIFIPAKEVISLANVIKSSRGIDKQFGFDDTYYDLIKSLEKNPAKGKIAEDFLDAFKYLQKITKGDLEYNNGEWTFKSGKELHNIYVVAEGFKKIAIVERLIRNRTLKKGSIIFIDEPEAYLHPQAVLTFIEMLNKISKQGIQIFIATHSYFVIKKLILIAQKSNKSISVVSLSKKEIIYDDLKGGFPDNPIINTSIALYEEEIGIE